MSTTPNPVTVPVVSLVPAWVHTYTAFIKAHENLLIILVAGFLTFHFYSKAINAWDLHEQRQVTLDQQKIDAQHQENVNLVQQLAALKLTVDNNAKLAAAQIAASHAQMKQQQQIDQQLPLPDLGQRWATLLSLGPGAITATSDGKLAATDPAARITVSALETIPDLTLTLAKTESELAGCNQIRAQEDSTLIGANNELVAEKKARIDDAKLAKAAQRKSWLRGFKWGFIGGFVTGVFTGHSL